MSKSVICQTFLIVLFLLQYPLLQAQNTLSISSVQNTAGSEVDVSVNLNNTSEVVAFQIIIPLYPQLKYVDNSCLLNPSRSDGHSITAQSINDTLKIFAFSLAQKPYIGSAGELLHFKLKLGIVSGNYPLIPVKSILSDAAGVALSLAITSGNVIIQAPLLQISQSNIDFGRVPIRASHTQYLNLQNTGNVPLQINNIVSSKADVGIDISFPKTIQAGDNLNVPLVLNTQTYGSFSSELSVSSNSAIQPQQKISIIGNPYSVNELYFSNAIGNCDQEVTVSVRMKNMESICGWQAQLQLNVDALEYVAGSFALSSRKTNHSVSSSYSNGKLVIMALSINNEPFLANDGEIATFKLKLKGQYGQYQVGSNSVILSNIAGINMFSDVYNGNVEIKSPNLYSGSYAVDFGNTAVNQETTSQFGFYNYGNANLVITDLVFTNPDFLHRLSFPITIAPWQNYQLPIIYKGTKSGNNTGLLKIYSNSPTNRLVDISLTANRFEPNSLSISDLTIDKKLVSQLSIELSNYSNIAGVQFDLQYPASKFIIQLNNVSLTNRAFGHSVVATQLNTNTLRILAFSMQNKLFTGNEGNLILLPISAVESTNVGEYQLAISNVVLSGQDANNKASETSFVKTIRVTEIPNGIENEALAKKIYPNPVINEININNDTNAFDHYMLFSLDGKKQMQGNLQSYTNKIGLNNIQCGVYILQLNGKYRTEKYEIIKQ